MPLVFVHGVNVREGKNYEKELTQRNQYFCNIFYKLLGREINADRIISPYWGDLATTVSAGSPFLPSKKKHDSQANPKAAISEQLDSEQNENTDQEISSLLDLARHGSLDQVIDLVIAAASEQAENTIEQAQELSKLAFRALELSGQFKDYDDEQKWLEGIQTDEQLLQKIEKALQLNSSEGSKQQQSGLRHFRAAADWLKVNYGSTDSAKRRLAFKTQQMNTSLQNIVKTAQTRVKKVREARRSATSHIAAAALTSPIRKIFHEKLFLFIGDAFLYFGQRGTPDAPGPIVQRVIAALDEACAGRGNPQDDPLIVVAHSMGGNIMSDIVSYFAPDKEIDVLITVASQFPLFADLHMFPGLDTRNRPIPKPKNVKRWINFYDVNDVFGFTAQPMFADVEDVDFASGRLGIATHADCFKFVSLYERMAEMVGQALF